MTALKKIFKWLVIIICTSIGVAVCSVALVIAVFRYLPQLKAEARIINALESHYAPAEIEIEDRVDWNHGRVDWGYGGQVCFDIRIQMGQSTQLQRRIAMIADGDDGGYFQFVGEYPSMEKCLASFNRG
jgi:hypothetical protein